MKMKHKQICRAFWLTGVACAYLLTVCGCTSVQKPATQNETVQDENDRAMVAPETEAMSVTHTGIEINNVQIQHIEGVEVVSGKVERVSGGMVYTPNTGSGYFTVNGTVADDSEIAICIHPVSVLRYKISMNVSEEKMVKAEIRMYKKGELLMSCTQEEMALQEGTNDIDVCVDTGEGSACYGTYDLRLYLDGRLVSEDEYEA